MSYFLAAGMLLLAAAVLVLVTAAAVWLGLRRGWGMLGCILLGAAVFLLLFSGLLAGGSWGTGENILLSWQREFQTSLDSSLQIYRQLGWEENQLRQAAWLIRTFFIRASFGWLALIGLALAGLGYFSLRRIFPDLPGAKTPLLPFRLWALPDTVVWILLVALALLVAGRWLSPVGLVGLNACVVLLQIYLLQGLAVAFFYLARWQVPRGLQILLILTIGFAPILLMLVALLGVLDTWANWRRLPAEPGR